MIPLQGAKGFYDQLLISTPLFWILIRRSNTANIVRNLVYIILGPRRPRILGVLDHWTVVIPGDVICPHTVIHYVVPKWNLSCTLRGLCSWSIYKQWHLVRKLFQKILRISVLMITVALTTPCMFLSKAVLPLNYPQNTTSFRRSSVTFKPQKRPI